MAKHKITPEAKLTEIVIELKEIKGIIRRAYPTRNYAHYQMEKAYLHLREGLRALKQKP